MTISLLTLVNCNCSRRSVALKFKSEKLQIGLCFYSEVKISIHIENLTIFYNGTSITNNSKMSFLYRKCDIKCLIRIQSSLTHSRALTAQTAEKRDYSKQQHHESIDVQPFESIPSLSVFQTLRRFSPGGECFKTFHYEQN